MNLWGNPLLSDYRQAAGYADNEETLKNRLDTYEKNAKPIIKYYKKKGKLKKVDATDTLKYTNDDIKNIVEI